MRKVKKPVFFIVFAVIALFTLSTIFGVHSQYGDIVKTYVHGVGDIRLGIDIQGGVDVTFEPAGDVDATEEQMDAALETIKLRLANQNISDSETYLDYKSNRIIVRYPWQAGETDFNPEQAVKELGETAELTFRKGTDTSTDENGDTIPAGDIVLTGADVAQASTGGSKDDATGEITWVVTLDLNDSGKEKFYEATSELYQSKGQISIWMDNTMISAPSVSAVISDGKASISGNFTYESAKELADKINSGALPFSLETTSFKTISPTMGEGALNAMVIAGLITLLLIVVYMIVLYRLLGALLAPGFLIAHLFQLFAQGGSFPPQHLILCFDLIFRQLCAGSIRNVILDLAAHILSTAGALAVFVQIIHGAEHRRLRHRKIRIIVQKLGNVFIQLFRQRQNIFFRVRRSNGIRRTCNVHPYLVDHICFPFLSFSARSGQ